MIAVLCGGVGAARLLRGLVQVHDPGDITAIVNTADDVELHGLHISPDLDTVTYTLAGADNVQTGWGLTGESWNAMEALERYHGATWFRLGDRDLATHLYRTGRLREGASLSTVTAEIVSSWDVDVHLLPMSDDPVRTYVTVPGEGELGFQEYFVGRRHDVSICGVRFDGADTAKPAPGVLATIADAEVVIVAPSNPIVSIGPLLAVPGLRAALARRREHTVAISPIIAGSALKGPADRMLRELGHDASVVGVARLYKDLISTLVIDEADATRVDEVVAAGVGNVVVGPTVMSDVAAAATLAQLSIGAITGVDG